MKKLVLVSLFLISLEPIYELPFQNQQEIPITLPRVYWFDTSLKVGDKYTVEEISEWSGIHKTTAEDETTQISVLKKVQQNYSEEIIEIGEPSTGVGILSKRVYNLSKVESNLPEIGIRKDTTSLEGKMLIIETQGHKVTIAEDLSKEKGIVLKEDLIYLDSIVGYEALLPTIGLKIGDTYEIKGKEVVQSFFREYYEEGACWVTGKGKLEGVINDEARLSLVLKASHKGNKTAPTFEVELSGTCYFSLKKKIITYLELTGPFKLSQETKLEDVSIKTSSEGKLILKRVVK